MSPISILFAGTPKFAVPCLQALIDDPDISVDLVITQPDRAVGRKQILTAPPVKDCALQNNIEVWQPESINKETDTLLKSSKRPDYLVVVAYGQMLSQQILDIPMVAPINIHPSLLPRWRGASPIQHAMLAVDTVTGVTVQRMVIKMDAGPILAQQSIPLTEDDYSPELHTRLFAIGSSLLLDVLKKYPEPQEQSTDGIMYCKKLSRENGKTDPSTMTAQDIHRHVRALLPWPGVTCCIHGTEYKLHATSLQESSDAYPLQCKDNTILYIHTLQEPGKNVMQAKQWMQNTSL